jgi:hypothetical protein
MRAGMLTPMIPRGMADWIAEELGNARAERLGDGNAVIPGKVKGEQWIEMCYLPEDVERACREVPRRVEEDDRGW